MLGGLIGLAVADAYISAMQTEENRINREQQLAAARQNAEYEIQKKRQENMMTRTFDAEYTVVEPERISHDAT